MTVWDHYWFGPVAAVRPFLAMRAVYVLLALDVWMVEIPRGARYGAGGFDVAHFRWLDAVRPMPSPDLYVGLMLVLGLLCLVCALLDPARWLRAVVAILHTYGWTMSFHDTFQHHYFLSLVLITLVFFPRIDASGLAAPGPRRVSAWAYALLGANVGVVYAYTAVTKLDPFWRSGELLRRAREPLLEALAASLAGVGVTATLFWSAVAVGVFVAEAIVAAGYLAAPRRDDTTGRAVGALTLAAFALAVSFHVSAETVLTLKIGWFSYYMIALACVYLLPAGLLRPAGAAMARVATGLDAAWGRAEGQSGAAAAAVAVAAVILVATGFVVDLPGARVAGILVALVVVAGAVGPRLAGRPARPLPLVAAAAAATAAMGVVFATTATTYEYHAARGHLLEELGERGAAMDAYERAERHGTVSFDGLWQSGDTRIRITVTGSEATAVFVKVGRAAQRLGFKVGDTSFVAAIDERNLAGEQTIRYPTRCYPSGRAVAMVGLLRPGGDNLATHFYSVDIDDECEDTGKYWISDTLWERPGRVN